MECCILNLGFWGAVSLALFPKKNPKSCLCEIFTVCVKFQSAVLFRSLSTFRKKSSTGAGWICRLFPQGARSVQGPPLPGQVPPDVRRCSTPAGPLTLLHCIPPRVLTIVHCFNVSSWFLLRGHRNIGCFNSCLAIRFFLYFCD